MIYIAHPESNLISFLIDGIKKPFVEIVVDQQNPLLRLERFIYSHGLPLVPFLSLIWGKKTFAGLKNGDVLICWGIDVIWDLKVIKKSVPKSVKCYLWQWNPFNRVYYSHIQENIDLIKRMGYCITCFDKSDAEIYKLTCLGQIYRKVDIKDVPIVNDFYYLGASKNRHEMINDIASRLSKYKLDFRIIDSSSDFITYEKNLEGIYRAKCIVDVNQKGQQGLSLRPVEALFCKKKLLTTNTNLKYEAFYNANNIFIVGLDDWDKIDSFLNSEYQNIPEDVINNYDINTWIDFFDKGNNN